MTVCKKASQIRYVHDSIITYIEVCVTTTTHAQRKAAVTLAADA